MKQRLFRTRRLGVALIAGVTALGAAATVGEGVASAAPAAVSAVAASSTTILPNSGNQAGGNLNITISGPVAANDTIYIQATPFGGACSTTNNVLFTSASATETTPTTANATAAVTPMPGPACGGVAPYNNELKIVLPNPAAAGTTTTVSVTSIVYQTTNATPGAVALSGSYATTTSTTPFAVPSNATVAGLTLATVGPAATAAPGTANNAVTALTLSGPAGLAAPLIPTGTAVCLVAQNGLTFDTISGSAGSVTQTNGTSGALVNNLAGTGTASASAPLTLTPTAVTGTTVGFLVADAGATGAPQTFQLSGLHLDVPATAIAGQGTVNVGLSTNQCATITTMLASQLVLNVSTGPGTAIYGQTAEATAAAEFDAALVTPAKAGVNNGLPICNNAGNAILATAADPYDALSASYLEGQLSTGVLITPVSTTGAIDANTLAALQYAGVQRVYVVGGPLAVTQAEITTLQNTPAYNCGGLTKTGSNLVVYSGISGATAADTAVAIDNYITTGAGGAGSLPSLANAYSTASTYNQTAGNASTAGPTNATTAIVISSTDWQDADTVAPIAYKYHLPIILTSATSLDTQALTELAALHVNQVLVIGGQLALTNAVVTSIQGLNTGAGPVSVLRIAGQDYTQTAADLAMFEGKILGWPQSTLYVAQGTSAANGWGDSLAAAPLGALNQGGILLTVSPSAGEGQYTDAVLKLAGTAPSGLGSGVTSTIQVLGGPLAITAATITAMQNALAGK